MALSQTTVKIASGASLSARVDVGIMKIVGVVVPTGWTAAGIAFETAPEIATTSDNYPVDVDYFPVCDSGGTQVAFTAAASKYLGSPANFSHGRYVKLRSGTTAAPVAQGADRIVTLILSD